MKKIGLGIITCNALERFSRSVNSIPDCVDEFLIVNYGNSYPDSVYPGRAIVIQQSGTSSVTKTKNDLLRLLLEKNCEHIFIMGDDVLIKDSRVFEEYIRVSTSTGLMHLSWSNNYKQKKNNKSMISLSGQQTGESDPRSLWATPEPGPRYIHQYPNGVKVACYSHNIGVFSYYRRAALMDVGLMDENFCDAWGHIEHTYRMSKKGYTSPFGWFVDIVNSDHYIDNIKNGMVKNLIAANPMWRENVQKGGEYFEVKESIKISRIENVSKDTVASKLNDIYFEKFPYKILIKFPTRARTEKFFQTLNTYINFLARPDSVFFLISCDADDVTMNNDDVKKTLEKYRNLRVFYGNNKNKIEAINADMEHAPDFDILLLASDDMIPVMDGFDEIIREKMRRFYPDLDGVLWFNDGYRGNELNTLCILGKKYYQKFGYIYHPSYKSLWCDNEFMLVASMLKKQVYFENVIIKHDHPDVPGAGLVYDELMLTNQTFNSADRKNFKRRRKKNFYLRKGLFSRQYYLRKKWI